MNTLLNIGSDKNNETIMENDDEEGFSNDSLDESEDDGAKIDTNRRKIRNKK
jgi:hypothetical protein